MGGQPVDLDALAAKHGGAGSVDLDALAAKHGGASVSEGTWADKLGVQNPVGRAALDFGEGAAAGAASTVFHGGDLVRRVFGMDRVIDRPEVQHAMTAPSSIPGKVGNFAEQAAEFAVPLSKVAKASAGATIVGRALAEGLTSAGVGAVQSGGNPTQTATAGVLGAAGPIAGAATGGVLQKMGVTPEKMYQSALKPTWSMVKKDGLSMIDTGLKEQIPVSSEGLATVEQRINDIRQKINDGVSVHAAQGRVVDSTKVLQTLDNLKDFYRKTAAPQEALDTIKNLEDQFVFYHGQSIPLDKAQQVKINTYQLLKDSYGEMASAKVEGLKQIARGLKEQISQQFPEIAGLNEQQSKLLGLNDALYRALWRIENHQMMGIGSPLAATAGHAAMGGPGAMAGLIGKFVLDDPEIKSRLAMALAKAGNKAPNQAVMQGMSALKGTLQQFGAGVSDRLSPTLAPALAGTPQ